MPRLEKPITGCNTDNAWKHHPVWHPPARMEASPCLQRAQLIWRRRIAAGLSSLPAHPRTVQPGPRFPTFGQLTSRLWSEPPAHRERPPLARALTRGEKTCVCVWRTGAGPREPPEERGWGRSRRRCLKTVRVSCLWSLTRLLAKLENRSGRRWTSTTSPGRTWAPKGRGCTPGPPAGRGTAVLWDRERGSGFDLQFLLVLHSGQSLFQGRGERLGLGWTGLRGQKRGSLDPLVYVCLAPFWAPCQRNPRQTALRSQAESVVYGRTRHRALAGRAPSPDSEKWPRPLPLKLQTQSPAANSISSDRRCPDLAAPGTLAASAAGSRHAPSGRAAETQPLGRALRLQWEESEVAQSFPTLWNLCWTVAHQAPQSMRIFRQEYWSGLSFSSPGDGRRFTVWATRKAQREGMSSRRRPVAPNHSWKVPWIGPSGGLVVKKGTTRAAETP